MLFFLLKSFHIIGVVCWFAGLFYIVRLFIYDVEALHKVEPDKTIIQKQLRIMQRRLWYGITVPSMVLTTVCGIALLVLIPYYLKAPNYWMYFKLLLVVLLMVYHHKCGAILKQLKNDTCRKTSNQLRIFNEIPTILLCITVFTVVMKSIVSPIIITAMLFVAGVAIFKIYRKKREGSKTI